MAMKRKPNIDCYAKILNIQSITIGMLNYSDFDSKNPLKDYAELMETL